MFAVSDTYVIYNIILIIDYQKTFRYESTRRGSLAAYGHSFLGISLDNTSL